MSGSSLDSFNKLSFDQERSTSFSSLELSAVKDEAAGKDRINNVIKRQQTLIKVDVTSTYHLAQELWLEL